MLDIVLASVLLSTDASVDEDWFETLHPTLTSLAISSEIIDPKEKDLTLAALQRRNEEFKNYPMLGECSRWPERKLIVALLGLNRSCRNDLTRRLEVDLFHEDEIKDAINNCDQLYQVLDTLRDAQCDYYYVTVRRQALKLLRDLIGEEAFYSGYLPPPVPIWYLPRN